MHRYALFLELLPALALAQTASEPPKPRSISVTGDAQVKVPPDQVILTLAIQTSDKDLMIAKQQNDERARKVLQATQQFHIEPKHVQTTDVSIDPHYLDSDRLNFQGFFVRKSIVICLKDVSRFEDLLTALLKAGTNQVQGIQFQNTQLRKFRDQTRQMAIRVAKEKATALASELGEKLGHPLSIQEGASGSTFGAHGGYGTFASGSGAAPDNTFETGFALGQLTVEAEVSVTFALLD
jgi:uncharacterized protein